MSKEEAGQNKPSVEQKTPAYDNQHEVGFVQEYTPVKRGIELHPKPTADPLDPLNFPRWRKWAALGIVMWM